MNRYDEPLRKLEKWTFDPIYFRMSPFLFHTPPPMPRKPRQPTVTTN